MSAHEREVRRYPSLAVRLREMDRLSALDFTERRDMEIARIARLTGRDIYPWVHRLDGGETSLWVGRRPTCCVYFIEAVGSGLVKIGWTLGDLEKRFRSLCSGNALPLKVRGFVSGQEDVERLFHLYFGAYRAHGEWFREEGEFAEYLKQFEGAS